jgi:single-strand DNA-binding protein
VNVTTLVGRLTADPNSRTVAVTGAERTVTTFGLAVPAAGDRATEPVYIDVAVWGATAQACASYLRRGRRIAVTGRLDLARWTEDDGTPRRLHRVVAHQVDFLDGHRTDESRHDTAMTARPVPEAVR